MTIQSADLPEWTRRHFVRVGLISAGAAALGTDAPWRIASAFAATDPASDLDNLARSLRGRMLRGASPGYDEARKVWNLAYDRRPLAMVRAAHIDDVRHCVEFARKHSVPIAIRGVGHSYAANGVAARIPMTATAYPPRGTGLSSIFAATWDRSGARARRAVGGRDWRRPTAVGAPRLRELPAAQCAGTTS